MNHRQRVLRTLNHQEPDRVPVDFGGWISGIKPQAHRRLCEYLGINKDGWNLYSPNEQILEKWDIDLRRVTAQDPSQTRKLPNGLEEDEWGVIRKHEAGDEQIVKFPLQHATFDDIDNCKAPDPSGDWDYTQVREQAKKLQEKGFAVVVQPNCQGVFEQACWLCGFERVLIDMLTNPEFIHSLFEKITRIQEQYARDYYSVVGDYADIVQLGDDLGTQQGPFISDELYRKLIRPYQARYHEAIRAGTSARIFHHSCGSVYKLLNSMIEAGIDILNPVQLSALDMDAVKLKDEFGDRVIFHGTMDVQTFLPVKSPSEIRAEVKRLIKVFAPGGGYIMAPSASFLLTARY